MNARTQGIYRIKPLSLRSKYYIYRRGKKIGNMANVSSDGKNKVLRRYRTYGKKFADYFMNISLLFSYL